MAVQSISQQQIPPASRSGIESVMQKIGAFVLEYWALVITIFLGIIVLAALSVPFLTYFGMDGISKPIFYSLHLICAQIPSHSFYIMGHQLGMCARNMSIYSSMFAGGLIFLLSKKRLPGIPWWLWVLLILPMAYDGLTQMFGLRESTWELRVITGTLFGLANMWFALPLVQRTLKEALLNPGQAPMAAPALQPSPVAPTAIVNAPATTPAVVSTDYGSTQATPEPETIEEAENCSQPGSVPGEQALTASEE
jgi:uncharacterized membrane protein